MGDPTFSDVSSATTTSDAGPALREDLLDGLTFAKFQAQQFLLCVVFRTLRSEGHLESLLAIRIDDPGGGVSVRITDPQPLLNDLLTEVRASIIDLATVVDQDRFVAGDHIVGVAYSPDDTESDLLVQGFHLVFRGSTASRFVLSGGVDGNRDGNVGRQPATTVTSQSPLLWTRTGALLAST